MSNSIAHNSKFKQQIHMNNLNLNGQPFENLRICYFKVYDQKHEKIFLDATDEQILIFLVKIHETVNIIKIEEVEVLSVTTHIPKKRKLDLDELKNSMSFESKEEIANKILNIKNKYEEK